MPVTGTWAERWRASQEGWPARGVDHVRVDGDLDQVGTEDVGAGLDEDREGRDEGLQLVRREVAQEAAHQPAVVSLANDVFVLAGTAWVVLSGAVCVVAPCVLLVLDCCSDCAFTSSRREGVSGAVWGVWVRSVRGSRSALKRPVYIAAHLAAAWTP